MLHIVVLPMVAIANLALLLARPWEVVVASLLHRRSPVALLSPQIAAAGPMSIASSVASTGTMPLAATVASRGISLASATTGGGNEKQAAIAEQSSTSHPGGGGYTPSCPIDPAWYFDTGATDHMTNEAGHLQAQEPYRGRDKVRTADGSGMPITHVGQASLLSSSSRRLRLHNVLRVPLVTHPLLSVRKFTYDNDVFCEFHPFHLLVKD